MKVAASNQKKAQSEKQEAELVSVYLRSCHSIDFFFCVDEVAGRDK